MYKQTGTHLSTLGKEEIENWIKSFDTVLCDCDGVLWVYMDIIKGSNDVVNKFKEMGKKVFFVTNNSTKTQEEFLEKALKLKFNMVAHEIVSTAFLAAKYLKSKNFNKKVYVIGTKGITQELDAVGIRHNEVGPDILDTPLLEFVHESLKKDPEVGAVIVGFDEHFSFKKMIRAASYLDDPNVIFIGTNTDERFPMPNFIIPGTGSIIKAVETCAERPAIIMGKPDPFMCDALIEDHGIIRERTLMVGDRCNTDILLGKNCGFQTLLVETGIHNGIDVQKWKDNDSVNDKLLIPDVIASSFAELLPFLD